MSERSVNAQSELADLIDEETHVDWFSGGPAQLAGVILAAGYRKPRTITTLDELKAVYEGAVLVDPHGDVWSIDGATGRLFSISDGNGDTYGDDDLDLPATVVYEEEGTK